MATSRDRVEHVVFDTVAFVGEHPQLNFGSNVGYWTTNGVLAEVKDKRSKFEMERFPYKLQRRVVSLAAMKEVEDFARKTGDFAALSRTDMSVIALTLMLERETNGDANIKSEPVAAAHPARPSLAKQIASENKGKEEDSEKPPSPSEVTSSPSESTPSSSSFTEATDSPKPPVSDQMASDQIEKNESDENVSISKTSEEKESSTTQKSSPSPKKGSEKSKTRSWSGEWITPENLKEKMAGLDAKDTSEEPLSSVAILTTDFAMQNVALQLGLRLITVNGLSIRTLRQWVNKCYACFKICRDTSRVYCPYCGGATMTRVSVYVDKNGKAHYRMNKKHITNKRGTRYSIPKRKGGRKNNDLVLREDEWQLQKKKQPKKVDLFLDMEEFASDKVTQRNYAHNRQKYGYGRKNPNEVRKSRGKRKKHL